MNRFPIIIVLAVLLTGCGNQDQALQSDIEIPVTVEDIRLKPIEEFINSTGTVYPKGSADIKAQISARYYLEKNPRTGKLWQLGDKVKAGELLVRLEDEEYVNSIKIDAQELNLELTESELSKQESLYEKGGVTQKDLKNAGYNVVNARYSVENARLQLAKTKVIAPFEGVIVEMPYFTQGVKVDNNSLLVKIMDYQEMFLDIRLPEKYISSIKSGQEVRITNYTLSDDTLKGKISQMSPAIDTDTRTFLSHISIDNGKFLLRPGMFVRSDIVTARKDSAIVIPKDIIISRQRGKTVFVVDRGLAVERVIVTGLENNNEMEVISGLSKNERIVTSGFETLSNRSKVKIIK